MNFINRAFKNVSRKLSKTILLTLAFFLIGNLVIIGLGVASATDNAKKLTRQKMRAVVTYMVDYEAVWEYADTIEDEDELNEFYAHYPSIKLEYIRDLMGDERIKTANANASQMFYKTDEFDFVHLNNEAENNMGNNGQQCYYDIDGKEVCETYVEPTYFVKGNFFPSMIEIEDGDYIITEGRFYSQEEIDSNADVILISNELAKVNNLNIGDSMSLYCGMPGSAMNNNVGITANDLLHEYEIIGLYDTVRQITPDSDQYDWTYPYENPNNMILMPATTLYMTTLEMQQKQFDYYANQYPDDEYYKPENRPTEESIINQSISDVTFLLSDPLDVDAFVEEYKDGLPQFMKLDANNEEFEKLSKPLDTLNLYANFIIWLVVINAVVIITLVTALTLKTREYEIGVLLSMGTSKIKVIGQFFIELALVAVLGFTLSVASGSIIANKVGQKVLEYQIQESDLNNDEYDYGYDYYSIWDSDYTTDVTLDDLVGEYNVSISPLIIAEIYVLGLGIVFVSIIIPSMMIMRFNPKKILMNQN